MKKIFLALLAVLVSTTAAVADSLISGEYYKICTADGTKALTNGGSTANNTILKMAALDAADDGQIWQITASGDYYTIKSSLGAVNADNPAESHSKWSNQLLQWQTSGGNNQKWTFKDAGDGNYYLIPYESAEKCYGYAEDGTFTFQDLSEADNQKLTLVKYEKPKVVIDGIESDAYYRLCSLDGTSALSNLSSTANNKVVCMTAYDEYDEGQIWQISRSGNYWTIQSSLGAVSLDNPSANHSGFNNQLIQWKTTGGDNQKWTIKPADTDGVYYLIPYENSAKCYGYNSNNGIFTFQDLTEADNQKIKLVAAVLPTAPLVAVNGYCAIQAVSAFPDYNYNAEGKFLSVSTGGSITLSGNYTYANSRLYVESDEDGVASVTVPGVERYLYASGTSIRTSSVSDDTDAAANRFVFYIDTENYTLDTHVAIHAGNTTDAQTSSSLNVLAPTAAGTTLSIGSKVLSNAYTFRIVPLPAQEDVDRLKELIDEANTLLSSLSENSAALLKTVISSAQNELDYPYLTKKDVVTDLNALRSAMNDTSNGEEAYSNKYKMSRQLTGIGTVSTSGASVTVVNGSIVVKNATGYTITNAAGQKVANGGHLPAGVYIVVADGQSFKVSL